MGGSVWVVRANRFDQKEKADFMSANKNGSNGTSSRWSIFSLFGSKAESQPDPSATITKDAHEEPLPKNAPRILVVDDDEVILKTTEIKLRAQGYAVITATDGSSAIHAARSERPDLILLDIGFPPEVSLTWDGFGILNWLRRFEGTRSIPVVIVTGNNGDGLYKRANEAGAAGFFRKPLPFTPLLSLIKLRLKTSASTLSMARSASSQSHN